MVSNPIREKRLRDLEQAQLKADLAKARADLDYVSMITGVEVPIPEDEEGENYEIPEV